MQKTQRMPPSMHVDFDAEKGAFTFHADAAPGSAEKIAQSAWINDCNAALVTSGGRVASVSRSGGFTILVEKLR